MALPLAVTAGAVGAPNPVLLPTLVVVADVLPNPLPPKPLVVGAEEPNPPDAAPNPAEDELGVVNPLDDKLNPPLDDPPGGVGVGGLSHPLFAASNACFCASGLLPASIMPDNVPVRNVAIGIISSKNLESIGLIAFNGCVTNIKEYSTTNTIPNNVNARQMPIKNFKRAINCSSVYKIGT